MNEKQETGISVLIMGVGRSGTTAIYALLQEVLENIYPNDMDYVYEPFLWDRKTFNKLYRSLSDEFRYSASVSIDGMYHHKRLPMLVREDFDIDPDSRAWLKGALTPQNGKKHYLGKMIRANGRVRLIRKLAPNTKIIFLIRNPVDVLNSASQLFSFYGSEFYESDFPRFVSEVGERYRGSVEPYDAEVGQIAAEYGYWYFSNLAFLDYARENSADILTVSYEAFVEDRAKIVQRICEFLGLEFHLDYAVASRKEQGPVQQNITALSEPDFEYLSSKIKTYKSLLEDVDEVPMGALTELIKTTTGDPTAQPRAPLPEFNSLHGGNELRKALGELTKTLRELRGRELECDRLSDELARVRNSTRYRFINRILAPIDALRKHLT